MPRHIKRLIIIFIYLFIAAMIFAIIFFSNAKPPSCTDGKRNQNEKGVDCGGVCGACPEVIRAVLLNIESVNLMVGGENSYDVVAKIKNPNSLYGAREFSYTFVLKNEQDQEIGRRQGQAFALPNQSRYIAEVGIESDERPVRAELIIGADVDWVKFTGFQDPDFVIDNSTFGLVESGTGYAQATAVVRNRSNFEFQSVGAIVILKDSDDRPIAINKTVINDFEAQQQRDFTLKWPTQFPGELYSMEVDVEADIYDAENFIKQFTDAPAINPF